MPFLPGAVEPLTSIGNHSVDGALSTAPLQGRLASAILDGRSRVMLGLRLPELLIILVVLVLVFGPNRIPQLGDALGRGIHDFKKTFEKGDSVDVTPEAQQGKLPHASATAMPHAGADQKVQK
jgi:sec-independent protein translocase protein TatA